MDGTYPCILVDPSPPEEGPPPEQDQTPTPKQKTLCLKEKISYLAL